MNIVNATPFLREARSFPPNIDDLAFQSSKAYLETANAVNQRTIGIYPVIKSAITGDQYFLQNNLRQSSLRQVFTFGAILAGASLSIPYKTQGFSQFSKIYGTCITIIPDYRPLPYSSVTANANIEVLVTTTNIVINVGAASPNLASGLIVLEWLSQSWYSQDI